MSAAVRCYADVLGFQQESWGDDNFTCVTRGGAGIYPANQGHPGSALLMC